MNPLDKKVKHKKKINLKKHVFHRWEIKETRRTENRHKHELLHHRHHVTIGVEDRTTCAHDANMNDSSPFHHCDSCRWPFPDSKCQRTTYLLRHPFSDEGYEYVFNSKATWHVYPSPICDHSLQLLIAQPYYSYKPHAPQASVTTPNKHTECGA